MSSNICKALELGNSKALFNKMNGGGGNRRFVSKNQLESKPTSHSSPGAQGGGMGSATVRSGRCCSPHECYVFQHTLEPCLFG